MSQIECPVNSKETCNCENKRSPNRTSTVEDIKAAESFDQQLIQTCLHFGEGNSPNNQQIQNLVSAIHDIPSPEEWNDQLSSVTAQLKSHLRERFIQEMPKCELHLHIEGTFETDLIFQIADRNGLDIKIEGKEVSKEEFEAMKDFDNLETFLNLYYAACAVLKTSEDFYDLAYAYFLQCQKDNVILTEIFFDPQTHTSRGIELETILDGLNRAVDRAEAELGVFARILTCIRRDLPAEQAVPLVESISGLCKQRMQQEWDLKSSIGENHDNHDNHDNHNCNKSHHNDNHNHTSSHNYNKDDFGYLKYVIGIGLDGAEMMAGPECFQKAYENAKQVGLFRTAHAAEEGPADYITQCIKRLHCQRIDHGVRGLESREVIDLLEETNTAITFCPNSNRRLKVFERFFGGRNILTDLLKTNIKVTINSDDPAYFGGYLTSNFLNSANECDLSLQEIAVLCLNGFLASFTERSRKSTCIQRLVSFIHSFRKEHKIDLDPADYAFDGENDTDNKDDDSTRA